MIVAFLAGIRIFATGGMGGVHRGAESSWDVSADLEELSRTSVCVVCAGAKSILDLPKTLEYLETKGVPVIGYGTGEGFKLEGMWEHRNLFPPEGMLRVRGTAYVTIVSAATLGTVFVALTFKWWLVSLLSGAAFVAAFQWRR